MRGKLAILLVASVFAFAACSGSSGTTDIIPDTDYVAAAEDVAPAFTAPAAMIFRKADEPTWGNRSFQIAVLFAKDAVELGTSNIYNNVTTAQNIFDDFKELQDLAEYAFDSEFEEPFFGEKETYQYAANYSTETEDVTGGAAMLKDGDKVSILSTSGREATETSGQESGVMKASYDSGSKILDMDVVQYVNYDEVYKGENKGQFIMRMQVIGNAGTHTFNTLKAINYNPNASGEGIEGYYLNILGKGVSQGAGEYFLFRITDANGSDPEVTDGYFCVAADSLTVSTDFITPKTEEEIEDTDCAQYLEDVKGMEPLDKATDLPQQAFDVSIPGNPKIFVMEFNPIPSP